MFGALWTERYRPQTLKDLVLAPDVRTFFENAIKEREIPHLLFFGPPGTGKTTLAKILVKELDSVYRYVNASDERGIDSIREKIVPFAQTKSIDGKLKIIILDECDGMTADAQRALRNVIEEYCGNVRFILTANSKNKIIDPIKSRAIPFGVIPPIKDVNARIAHIIINENITVSDEQRPELKALIENNYPDMRKIIGLIQKHTKDNVLNIVQSTAIIEFAGVVLKMIIEQKDMSSVREYIIQNETEFNSDYLSLLKGLFEETYNNTTVKESEKASALVTIGEAMYKHSFVMDFEINAFCCILQLKKLLS